MSSLSRFLNPKSIAIVGGVWAVNVIRQLNKAHYSGDIWPVNPKRKELEGHICYASLDALPNAPDAAFLAVNREQTIKLVTQLAAMKAGGAVCFASGFKEANTYNSEQTDWQSLLVVAADSMPFLGPNCYGFLNYQTMATIWPDEHGGQAQQRGVAIIAQSSNIAINLSMQRRGLPITHLFTVGNQASLGISDLIDQMLDTQGVSAIGLYIEGIDDLDQFCKTAIRASECGKPIVVIKSGKTEKSQQAAMSHTASLTGSAAASSALFERLGIGEVNDIEVFLETLKLLHFHGPLTNNKLVSVSCSGGEASMMADLAAFSLLDYADFSALQRQQLRSVLGNKVALANPLDYHTYIWGDVEAMTACFSEAASGHHGVCVFVLDVPQADRCDPTGHECAIESIIATAKNSQTKIIALASMYEGFSESHIRRFLEAGVVPLRGMNTALLAINASIEVGQRLAHVGQVALSKRSAQINHKAPQDTGLRTSPSPTLSSDVRTLSESEAKTCLASFSVPIPKSNVAGSLIDVIRSSEGLNYPLVLKAMGLAHKTEKNAVVVNIACLDELESALIKMPDSSDGYLIEEMVLDKVLELLVGVTVDKTGITMLVIGAGGVHAEILADTRNLVLPVKRQQVLKAVNELKIAPLLHGYRGAKSVDIDSMADAILAIADCAISNLDKLVDLEVNPLIVGAKSSFAVDALMRLKNID